MSNFFVNLYNYFQCHKIQLYVSLVAVLGIMVYFSLQLKFQENINQFFPDTRNENNLNEVFDNLRVKDKIVVMFSNFHGENYDNELFIESATQFRDSLWKKAGGKYIDNIVLHIDDSLRTQMQDFVYQNLPIFLTDSDYQRMDSLFLRDKVAEIMQRNYSNLLSPAGGMMKDFVMRDPFGMGGNTLKHLQDFQMDTGFEQHNGYIFSKDGYYLLMFITPTYSMGSTGENDKLITIIEEEIGLNNDIASSDFRIQYFGGPSVSVYNARQIKQDSMITGIIALVIIIAFILLVFRKKRTILQIVAPALFGVLFAICLITLIKGSISAIAIGAGSVIIGVALSYSIHMVVHQSHVSTVQQLIKELTYPLTVGSFTTIGAFLGLLFTNSQLLRDFGLFASLSLIGTILFCLIYLPHFLDGRVNDKKTALLRFIEKFNAYRFDKNKWLVGGIVVLLIVCAFTSQNVGFDADMMHINYEPEHLKNAEVQLSEMVDASKKTIIFASVGKEVNEATQNYHKTNQTLSELKDKGLVNNFASANYFLVPQSEQKQRLQKWNDYWTSEKKSTLKSALNKEASVYGFKEGTFDAFVKWLDMPVEIKENYMQSNQLLGDWQNSTKDLTLLISQAQIDEHNKEEVYKYFGNSDEVIILDRAYFTSKWVSAINDDFYLILFISSFLIFITLLFSYGRIELTLISFSPMFISWIIIIGIMGIFGMEFNIINIILSTFIFGIGDDFSIFIMDGLQNKYRANKPVLNGHKTAIFFSAFTIIVGLGALVFAQHPALKSISVMSILGMVVVVLVSYTIPPVLFRLFFSSQTDKGQPPYTAFSIMFTTLVYSLFLIGCVLLRIVMFILYPLPIKKTKKRAIMCYLMTMTCRFVCFVGFAIKIKKVDINKEVFKKPTLIIANHQSFLDILLLISLSSKVVMVTNQWVWKSPFFGAIIRYAGYFYIGEGYDGSVAHVKGKIDAGYSVAIFPEGTRSYDGKLKRFHKGAFYLCQELNLDIVPIVFYGTGMVISKAQPFNIKRGFVVVKMLPRIESNNTQFGQTYREKTKKISTYFASEYGKVLSAYNTSANPYFSNMLIKNYIYKGPVEEWYIRIKLGMEKNYQVFDELIPRKGQITDIGCGYGMMCYMLSMLSPERKLLGVDYDEDKIDVARHGYLRKENINFDAADALEYDYPESDVFVLNDMLHYISHDKQEALLTKCMSKLRDGGQIIVRDGDSQDKEKQKITRLSETFSTRIFGFNKTKEELCFTSAQQLKNIADANGMQMVCFKNDKYTSNTIFIFKKKTGINGEI